MHFELYPSMSVQSSLALGWHITLLAEPNLNSGSIYPHMSISTTTWAKSSCSPVPKLEELGATNLAIQINTELCEIIYYASLWSDK